MDESELKYLEASRTRARLLAMLPLMILVIFLAFFLFEDFMMNSGGSELKGKLLFLGIAAAVIFGAWLLTGVFIPKREIKGN